MQPESPIHKPSISTHAGTTVEVVQSTRRMNFLTVHENELDTISAFNTQSTTFFSLSSGCGSLGLTLSLNALFTDKLPPMAAALCWIGIPLSIILAITFFFLAKHAQKSKNGNIARIRNESQGSHIQGKT